MFGMFGTCAFAGGIIGTMIAVSHKCFCFVFFFKIKTSKYYITKVSVNLAT